MNQYDRLTKGPIVSTMIRLALPLMATAFVYLAYTLTDIFWIGRLGVEQVAATGTIGYFIWLADSLVQLTRVGVSIFASRAFGENDVIKGYRTIWNGLVFSVVLALLYASGFYIFQSPLILFFHLGPQATQYALDYLSVVIFAFPSIFINPILSASYNSLGNSKIPFLFNSIGLFMNILLDPLFIFGGFIIPQLGIRGAALATTIANFFVTTLFFLHLHVKLDFFKEFSKIRRIEFSLWKKMLQLGFPSSAQNAFHALISMVLTRFVAFSGDVAVAVYSTGSQMESLTWLTTEGLAFSFTAFIGQNIGAKAFDRIRSGIRIALLMSLTAGSIGSFVLIAFRHQLFGLFVANSEETVRLGAIYLLILGISQVFMGVEIGTTGIYHGLGETTIPSLIGIVFNALRIPLSLLLMPSYGAIGVWAAISISSICKGILVPLFLKGTFKRKVIGF